MKRMWWSVLVMCIGILLMSSSGWGEYYQYIDPDGVVRFTDDPSLIPPGQQDNAKVHESIVSDGVYSGTTDTSAGSEGNTEMADSGSLSDDSDTSASQRNTERLESEELDAMRNDLVKAFRELEAEKKALGPPPPDSAKSGVKADYVIMSKELNKKIQAYNEMSLEFEEKVKAFNKRVLEK